MYELYDEQSSFNMILYKIIYIKNKKHGKLFNIIHLYQLFILNVILSFLKLNFYFRNKSNYIGI